MTRGRCLALVVVACLFCPDVARAQVARSQFNGTVTDSAGGVLVGVTVIATNVETNVASKTTTTDAGVYVIPYLANGLYRVRVEAKGFRPAQAEQVTLRAAQTLTLDFKLDVDAIVEAVTVSAPVIETSTAEIGHYVSNKEYPDLADPGGGRPAAGAAVHLFEPARVRPAARSKARSTAAATIRTRSSSKAFRSAGTCRAAATTRCRRRPRWWASSSCRPARSAPNSAAARPRSPTSSSSPARTTSTGRARSTCRIRRWTRGRSTPRRSTRTFRYGRRRTGRSPSAARSCCRNTTARTAASSMPRSRRPTRKTRHRPRSARCRRASSRTAISRGCSIRLTRATPAPGRPSELMPSGAPYDSVRSTTRAPRASSTAG